MESCTRMYLLKVERVIDRTEEVVSCSLQTCALCAEKFFCLQHGVVPIAKLTSSIGEPTACSDSKGLEAARSLEATPQLKYDKSVPILVEKTSISGMCLY